jgi:hypothetical protein
MSGMSHEARINEALRQLGEEHRLGMVQPEEYRSRRRMLIESWHEKEVTTSPGSLRSAGFTTIPPGKRKAIQVEAPSVVPRLVLIGLALILGIAVSGYYVFAPRKAPEAVEPAVPPPAPLSPQVQAACQAAESFLAANSWDATNVEALLAQWRQLSPEDRARAREEPAIRTLRYKVDQNIQAESQLVAPDAPPEDRQRLDLLNRFAGELDA